MVSRLPAITHLQFLVLAIVKGGDQPGRVLRTIIARHGVRRTAAAFYQMMARLERDGMVEGWYEQMTVGDQAVTERWYRILPAGARAWANTRAFYDEAPVSAARPRWSDA